MRGCLSPRHDIAQSVQERVPNPGPEASGGALQEFPPGAIDNIGGSSSGRTADSDSVNRGSNPRPPATHESPRPRESARTLIFSKQARCGCIPDPVKIKWRGMVALGGRSGPGSHEACALQTFHCCRSVTKPRFEPPPCLATGALSPVCASRICHRLPDVRHP